MKVTLSSMGPTKAANEAGCVVLTPEQTGACAARYSRNPGGFEAIRALLAENPDEDKGIDRIFSMTDFGHASIADLVEVPMWMDGISLWLAYYIWSICPLASGQETSTRYVDFSKAGVLTAEEAGIPEEYQGAWEEFIKHSATCYDIMTKYWQAVAATEELELPPGLKEELESADEDIRRKANQKLERFERNFVLDRSRYWIPVAAKTNVMMKMHARAWTELCSVLLSHYSPEAIKLGELIRENLELVAPRLIKHARRTDQQVGVHIFDAERDSAFYSTICRETNVKVKVVNMTDDVNIDQNFRFFENRYSPIGKYAKRTSVVFGMPNIAMAELRDLNRHRTGSKFCCMIPTGFFGMPVREKVSEEINMRHNTGYCFDFGRRAVDRQREISRHVTNINHPEKTLGFKHGMYWGLLGSQYYYEHTTDLAHSAYEIELRTGAGTHPKYAEHMSDVHRELLRLLPRLEGYITVGTAEPEVF